MAKKKPAKLREDMAETARRVFLESVGEAPKTLAPSERTERNANAVKRGRKGGKKGGRARAAQLTKEQRSASAKKAAQVRWAKKSQD
jgi:hypothetical protein